LNKVNKRYSVFGKQSTVRRSFFVETRAASSSSAAAVVKAFDRLHDSSGVALLAIKAQQRGVMCNRSSDSLQVHSLAASHSCRSQISCSLYMRVLFAGDKLAIFGLFRGHNGNHKIARNDVYLRHQMRTQSNSTAAHFLHILYYSMAT